VAHKWESTSDPHALEQQALTLVKTHAAQRHPPFDGELQIDEVRLTGGFPSAAIEVLFRWSRYPDLQFGRRQPIWDQDGGFRRWDIEDLVMYMGLYLPNRRQDLPPPKPDDSGIRWI
jgi:hypothetical protein